MPQLLSPIYLAALAGLLIPIAIHLWNRKSGRTIRIGSVRFLQASESHRFRSVKLHQRLLLLLRSLVVSLLVLLLASPVWQSDSAAGSAEVPDWILVSPEILADPAWQASNPLIDSLLAAGSEVRLLSRGFPPVSEKPRFSTDAYEADYWSLLREADMTAPAKSTFQVFTPNRLTVFGGERPTLVRRVLWTPVERFGENRWIEEARRVDGDSLKLVIGVSDSLRTYFHEIRAVWPKRRTMLSHRALPPIEINPVGGSGGLLVRVTEEDALADDNEATVSATVPRNNVLISYDDSRMQDAIYLRAAIEAALEFSEYQGSVKSQLITGDDVPSERFDWIFRLSDKPVSDGILAAIEKEKTILFSDAASNDYSKTHTSLVYSGPFESNMPRLFRRVDSDGDGLPLWRDGFGTPMLTAQQRGEGSWHLKFYSRFHPFWTDLVSHRVFPELIMNLLELEGLHFTPQAGSRLSDRRMVASSQMAPQQGLETTDGPDADRSRSLLFPIWLLAAVLFCCERWLSERGRVTGKNAKEGIAETA